MSGNSALSFAAGIVGGVVGFFIGGPVGALYGFSLGTVAAGLFLGPETPEQTIRPEELRMSTSSESATVPVIFGTSRIAGNHIGYDRDSFRTKEITQEPEGGKGGGGEEQVVGYKYYLSYLVGLCMGPVDEVRKIYGSPGEDNVLFEEEKRNLSGTMNITVATDRITATAGDFEDWTTGQSVFVEGATDVDNDRVRGTVIAIGASDEYIELTSGTFGGSDETGSSLTLTSATTQAPQSISAAPTLTLDGKSSDGGSCQLFPGNTTQTGPSINGEILNYRGVCFAFFNDYKIGRQPSPRSYLFEMTRMPVCIADGGGTVTGMKLRASASSDDPEYYDANPAAVVWEILTNVNWGKATDPGQLNEAEFVAASEYYEEQRIGISTSMGSGGMQDLLDKIRGIFGLAVWWDGEEVRCRVLWDRTGAYTPRVRITEEDIIGTPVFNRQSISASINEIRMDFTNRSNLYQAETVTQQDLGSIEELGAVRSEKVDASEVGTRRAAELLAARLLRELAYPPAQLQLNVHRTFANQDIGDFVELYWDAWRTGGFTSFWRIQAIDDDETTENQVRLSLTEDIYATPRDGEITDFTAPIVSLEVDTPLDNDSFGAIDYTLGIPLGALTPILIDELPIWMSKGARQLVVGVQKQNRSIQSYTLGWADATLLDYSSLGAFRSFPIAGTLLDPISATGPKLVRDSADQFRLSLANSEDETDLLAAAVLVQDGTEDFSDLTARAQNIMVINGEIWRVGFIEELSPGEYTVRTAIRAEQGTIKQAAIATDEFWFFPEWVPTDYQVPAASVPIDTALKLRLQPFAPRGTGDITTIDGPDTNGFDGDSINPATPSLKAASLSTLTWTVEIRPVIHWGGAGYGPDFEQEVLEARDTIDPMRLRVRASSTMDITITEFFSSGSLVDGNMEITQAEWIPAVRGDPDTGMVQLTIVFTGSNPTDIDIYQRLNGRDSTTPLNVLQP